MDRRWPGQREDDGEQPRHVQKHEQRIVFAPDLHRPLREKRSGISLRVPEFGEPLRRDDCKDDVRDHSNIRNAAEKPGPSALIKVLPASPRSRMRCSTNSAVTADMLP